MNPSRLEHLLNLKPDIFSSFSLMLKSSKCVDDDLLYSKYFREHVINSEHHKDHLYKIHLNRTGNIHYFVENKNSIKNNVQWLIPNFQEKYLPFYFAFDNNSMVTLNDTWSLLGWVNYELNNKSSNEEIVIIHYDSHADLMSPLIIRSDDGMHLDFINASNFNIKSFWDIFLAICSGSIDIGGYISLLLLFFKKVYILHVNQFVKQDLYYGVHLDYINDTLISENFEGYKRMSINFFETDNKRDSFYYCVSSPENINLEFMRNKKVYLHIDMDYFNNKFDGSSDIYRKAEYDLPYMDQLALIKKMTQFLDCNKLQNNIVHTSIALSPGFFPSKYWEKVTQSLILSLKQIGINVTPTKVFPCDN